MAGPDYIKCIARTHADHKHESWCGRGISMEFSFVGLDHAAENALQGGRSVPCKKCVEAAVSALNSQER